MEFFLNWYDDAEEKHAHKIKGDLLLPSAVKAENPSNCTLGTKSAIADYIGQLNGHREESQALLHQLNAALHHLDELHSQYTSVSTRTTALHTDCEHLLAEQTSLSNTAEDIQTKLWYFTQVESISQKLTSPAFTVTSEGFIPLLAKIDQCIAYMRNNPKYRESSIYLVSSSDALHQVEYRNLLLDCHQCYFMQRRQLLGPCVTDAVAQLLAKYRKDHCTLVRSGCSFLVHVCEDEHMLFQQFFSLPTTELDNFLEGLCIALYDGLRPLIIHIDHLETLSELCSILRRGMIEEHLQSNPQQLSALRSVVTRMLEDAQERLVYRAHVYITTDIAGFTPSPGDVAYPSKLELMEQIAKEINDSARRASESGMAGVRGERFSRVGSSPADLHGMWYPTLRRTLMCLSKLYRCVDKTIFQVLELRMDSKQDVDQELKRVCERLIHTSTETLVGRLTAFIAKLQLITNMNSREKNIKPILLKNQPFATPEKVNELVSEVCRDIRSKLPKLQRDLHLYLANRDTEFILLKPVRVNVASSFGRLQKILSEEYSADDILIANCPSVDEINIMMNALLENRDEIKESSSRAGSVSQQKRTSTPVHGNEGETNLSRDESTLQEQSSPATVIAVSNGVADIGVNGQYPEVSSTQQASSTAELTSGLNGT
ncbi:hypothetical protein HAZT_HAZT001031 [Hyalella azteca]|uniref:Conserved oligomeric Golgi complex subunit 3 C-terminal domain-containing protein n=1 Tax=Hyalella azteca TaxID=294128 RepID=A0A6A0H623_HYAAZ|nr:hypothetical protein HAZT_HAZT001031 [Hyalella azteca]